MTSKTTGRAFGQYAPSTIEHRNRVVDALRASWGARETISGRAVSVRACFNFPRPASHYGTGRNEFRLKDASPLMFEHTKAPDLDKLARLIGDALVIARVIADDSLIASLSVRKYWISRSLEGETIVEVSELSR